MNNTTTLYKLLDKKRVVVPIIQRDYAQGRKDKGFIRKNFLKSIKDSLEKNENLTLDFVYGNTEGEKFFPLDGQQRLTTLWLVYWYLSYKAGSLSNDKTWLKKFSYETRTSSREFCKSICEKMTSCEITDNLSSYIKSQSWFYSSWLQDPTISAMLRTISGDEKDASSEDCIEGIFKDYPKEEAEKLLGNLKNECVTFELMEIGTAELPVSDDLYIKMNARGKALTDFENFKADFVKYLRQEDIDLENRENFIRNLDVNWTDVFWDSAKKDLGNDFKGNIDEAYYAFFNRFVVNELCLKHEQEMSSFEFDAEKEKEDNKPIKIRFNKLIGLCDSKTDDTLVHYEDFDTYRMYLDKNSIQNIGKILDFLSKNKGIRFSLDYIDEETEEDLKSDDKTFAFIPRYVSNNLQPTTLKERIYFLAICRFIETNDDFDSKTFEKWMRIVKNIVENAGISSASAMVNCLRLINSISKKMAENDWNVYECLSNYSLQESDNSYMYQQLREEIEKSKKICEDSSWEDKFVEAENYSFLNGSIRFLFRDKNNKIDFNQFDAKFNTTKQYFDANSNVVKTDTIEKFLSLFRSFSEIGGLYLFTNIGFHSRNNCWKRNILCSDDVSIICKVHSLLMCDTISSQTEEYKTFLDSGIIAKIVNQPQNYKYRYHWFYDEYAIHKLYSKTEGVYVSDRHKGKQAKLNKLAQNGIIKVNNEYINGYYWGTIITFVYKGNQYCWDVTYNKDDTYTDRIYSVFENGKKSQHYEEWSSEDEDFIDVLNRF